MKKKRRATRKAFEDYYRDQLLTPQNILWNQLDSKEMVKAFKIFKIPKNSSIVSSGCGTGQKEAELYRAGYHNIIAFDFSETAISMAKASNRDAKIDFQVNNTLNMTKDFKKKISKPDVWVDWMSMHNMNREQQVKSAQQIANLDPHFLIFRTFSKFDPEYKRKKRSLLDSMLPGIYRHFSSLKDIEALFPDYSVIKLLNDKPKSSTKFIDARAAAKITVLMSNTKYD
jgi:SAM-dependent methyltransferase